MKKRIFTLLLAVLLLTSLASCSKEAPEYGTFYTNDGIFQNSRILLTITSDNLTYPVTEISYVLHDLCDYGVVRRIYFANSMCCDQLEKYTNGKWVEAPIQPDWSHNRDPLFHNPAKEQEMPAPFEHVSYEITMKFSGENQAYYRPLEPGIYRLRVAYTLYAEDENASIPEEVKEAVAYFTVKGP
ncbi:MAG: hypothetical protein E7624_06295 [Ruminococcaceae bacterium]|nr:hypothetical protein [Oscillospiraceae bacterium]